MINGNKIEFAGRSVKLYDPEWDRVQLNKIGGFVEKHKRGIAKTARVFGAVAALGVITVGADTAKAGDPVNETIAKMGYAGIIDRTTLLGFLHSDASPLKLRVCPGEEDSCVQIPPTWLPNGNVYQFALTNPFSTPMEGYVCGNTNNAGLPVGKEVCAETFTIRVKGAKPTDSKVLNQTVDGAVEGLGLAGIRNRQDLIAYLHITNLDAGEIENCPAAGEVKPLPGKIEPNCVRIPARPIHEDGTEPRVFVIDHPVEGIVFDGWLAPFKLPADANADNAGKWATVRQRTGVPKGTWTVETMTIRQADFKGRADGVNAGKIKSAATQ